MPPVTAPMTGRTLAATTSSSVSPKSSGIGNIFLPRQTKLRSEKKNYNPPKKVVPTESIENAFVRSKLKICEWERTPLRVKLAEGFFARLMGKKQTVPAPAPAVKPVGVSQAQPPKKPAPKPSTMVNPALGKFRVSSQHSPLDTHTGKPMYQPQDIPMDAQGNMKPDADYDKVGSALQQSGAWGKDAAKHGPADAEPLPGQHGYDDGSSDSNISAPVNTSGFNPAKAKTRPVKQTPHFSSGMKKMPVPGSSQNFVRSRSSDDSDKIDPAD